MPPEAVINLRPSRPSHHFLRRRARALAASWEFWNPDSPYRAVVLPAARGPYRWRVTLRPKS